MAEGARLESVYTFTGIGGSNPSLSASLIPEDLEQIFSRLPHPATDVREIQARSVLAHGGYTDESGHLHPRKRHPSIQTSIAPSDVSSQRHLLPALHPWGQAQMGSTICQHI